MKGGALCDDGDPNDTYTRSSTFGGSTWVLYNVEGDTTKVIKEVGPAIWISKGEIEREIEIATRAGKLNVGPKVYYSKICYVPNTIKTFAAEMLPVGYIVMDKIVGRTLNKRYLADPGIKRQIDKLLDKLANNRISYTDLHSHNMMYGKTKDDKHKRVYLIDYGEARIKPKRISIKERKYSKHTDILDNSRNNHSNSFSSANKSTSQTRQTRRASNSTTGSPKTPKSSKSPKSPKTPKSSKSPKTPRASNSH
jgi:hypothetical protein